MRRLILIRHAKSDYPSGVGDHDRPLNDRGRRDAPFIGRWLDANVAWPDEGAPMVLVSSATRAQSTWSLAAGQLSSRWAACDQRTESRIYDASLTTLVTLIDEVPGAVSMLIVVGHNPGLVSAIDRLGMEGDNFVAALEKFPTSAIAVLETSEDWAVATARPNSWQVTNFVVPRAADG